MLVKADPQTVTVYLKDKTIATHQRSWQRIQRIELPHHREAAIKRLLRQWQSQEVATFASLGEDAKVYLEQIAKARLPLKKNVTKLLALADKYGSTAVIAAVQRALLKNAYGAH